MATFICPSIESELGKTLYFDVPEDFVRRALSTPVSELTDDLLAIIKTFRGFDVNRGRFAFVFRTVDQLRRIDRMAALRDGERRYPPPN